MRDNKWKVLGEIDKEELEKYLKSQRDEAEKVKSIVEEPVMCMRCGKRPATEKWAGTEPTFAITHGFCQDWCMICCLEEQIKYGEKQLKEISERLPKIKKELSELLEKEKEK